MKTKLFLLLLIIAITTSLSAQEKLTAEEMFRWFPEGKYDEVEHYDLETAQGLPGFHKFLKGRNKTVARWTHDIQMPSELKDKFSSVTTMTTVRIVVHKGKDAPAMGRGGKTSGARFGDQIYTANSFGIKMITVRTDGNLNLKKILPTYKSVESTEEIIGESPVYLFKDKNIRGEGKTYHMWLSPEQELLVCEEPKHLKKMIAAGIGDSPDVFADFPFPNLAEAMSNFGPGWTFVSTVPAYNAICEKAEKDGIDPQLISQTRTKNMYGQELVFDTTFGDPAEIRSTIIFADAESAQAYLSEYNARQKANKRELTGYSKIVQKNNVTTRKENLIIRSFIQSEELLKAQKEQREKREKEAKEREEKKAKAATQEKGK